MSPDNSIQVGRIDLGPTEPRHLTQTEQRLMDGALRQSLKIISPASDEAVRRVQAWLADEREAGRCVFVLKDTWIVRLLEVANGQ